MSNIIDSIRLSGTTYQIQGSGGTQTIELTQAQYDALVDKDPNTYYIITDATAGDLTNYYTKAETDDLLDDKLDVTAYTPTDLSNYYTKAETSGATQISTALNGYATTSDVQTATNDMATKTWVGQQGYLTEHQSLDNYVTLNSAQNITRQKTFVGNKLINFKQASSNNKLGFTLYNDSNSEVGFLEYGISNSKPYYELGFYRGDDSIRQPDLGFEIMDNYLKARYGFYLPQSSDAKEPLELTYTKTSFYTPLEFQNGTNKVRTANTGIVDLSTLIPTVTTSITSSSTDAQVPSAKAVNDKLGGLSLVKLTQAEYDALATKDNNTLYVIVN